MIRLRKQLVLFASCMFLGAAVTRFLWINAWFPFSGPRAVCKSPVFDFGVVKSGENVRHAFHILNRGTDNLKVFGLRPDCGCVAARTSADVALPNGHLDVAADFSLAGLDGYVEKRVGVYTNDARRPSPIILLLRGSVDADIHVEPKRLLIGAANGGCTNKSDLCEIQVFCDAGASFRVIGAHSSSPCLELRVESVVPCCHYRVQVTRRAARSNVDMQASTAIIINTDHPREPELVVPVDMASREGT